MKNGTIKRIAHVHTHCGTEPAPIDYIGAIKSAAEPNPAAHGGHCIAEVCACGLVRFVNVRDSQREIGAWEGGCEDLAAAYLARFGVMSGLVAEREELVQR